MPHTSPNRAQLWRLVQLDQKLRQRSYPNAVTLSRELEVAEKTVRRDIDYFRYQLGAPIEYDANRRGFFYTDLTYTLPVLQFSEGEMLGLFLGSRLLEQYRGTEFAEALNRLFEKIEQYLPKKTTLRLADVATAYAVKPTAADPVEVETFRQLAEAIRRGQQLRIVYWAASTQTEHERVVDPYGLGLDQGQWHLVAYCHLREAIRVFLPSRIRSLTATGATFARPAEFDLGKYLDASFGGLRGAGGAETVRLRFTPTAARYVRTRTWHATQTLSESPDGSVELSFAVTHLTGVRRFVLSWGGDCVVLAPDSLRAAVLAEAQRIVANGATP